MNFRGLRSVGLLRGLLLLGRRRRSGDGRRSGVGVGLGRGRAAGGVVLPHRLAVEIAGAVAFHHLLAGAKGRDRSLEHRELAADVRDDLGDVRVVGEFPDEIAPGVEGRRLRRQVAAVEVADEGVVEALLPVRPQAGLAFGRVDRTAERGDQLIARLAELQCPFLFGREDKIDAAFLEKSGFAAEQ